MSFSIPQTPGHNKRSCNRVSSEQVTISAHLYLSMRMVLDSLHALQEKVQGFLRLKQGMIVFDKAALVSCLSDQEPFGLKQHI